MPDDALTWLLAALGLFGAALGWRAPVSTVAHQLRRLAQYGVAQQSTDGSRTFRLAQPSLRPGEPC